jgi:phosphoribosylformylglycinamidine synthase
MWEQYGKLVKSGKVLAAHVYDSHMTTPCIVNMSSGNGIGFIYNPKVKQSDELKWGSIIFETSEALEGYKLLGETLEQSHIVFGDFVVQLDKLREEWESPLESVFPTIKNNVITKSVKTDKIDNCQLSAVNCVVPVLAGTNGDFDVVRAIERAGATAQVVNIRNLTPEMLTESITELEKAISSARMLVLPAGLETAGAFVALFRNAGLEKAVSDLLARDGLILGINDGFKALVKLGLLDVSGIFALNETGAHLHRYVETVACDVQSPWLTGFTAGEVYVQPVSSKTIRFHADVPESQVAFRYADGGVESVVSKCGKVLGKTGHFERFNQNTAMNVPGNMYVPLFEAAIRSLSS